MIYLAITPAGLAEALRAASPGDAVWCGSGAIDESAFAALRNPVLTRFTHGLDDADRVAAALDTIEDHHPGETVWVEATASR
ncbi:hypothetical protein [Rubrivivax benzoatilyticus]|uniref:Uncharacterized protein n=1 Tax=Rubrivivax benzoatilyticus TaxID=316997 RepID=A0ABX0HYY8_9BURK|nr:hypothetical protein [Rubrivivax benzoatilyticus]EGJ11009.1 hypothetical protein RBXJA2T_11812 [Rubrivivax benzoatilyticus JA2 = ATCC BAA-35]NHL00207.1 hypothetical protein [Rubrivivax benzoatilyticus]NHL26014.1 hypothetical protein [Rubrivivax benzoatilyticus]